MSLLEKEITERLELAKILAVKAGDEVAKMQGQNMEVHRKEGGVGDIVTLADYVSQGIIISGIKERFPDDDIDSEEKMRVLTGARFKQVWDPLDATVQFKTRAREWGVSGGVHYMGEPVSGVIYFPRLHLMCFAQKDKGAFIVDNGELKQIHTASESKLVEGTFGYNYPYLVDEAVVDQFITPVFKKFPSKTMYIHVPVCVTLALCNLAEGIGPLAIINANVTPYDLGAASVIVKESGGVISPIDWNKKRQPVLAAANREIYDETVNLLGPELLKTLGFNF